MAALICEACADCCSACGKVCDDFVDCVCPKDKPYPMFLSFTWITNLVPAIIAFVFAVLPHSECGSPIEAFLIISALASIGHMIFAVYIYQRVSNPPPEYQNKEMGVWATHLFCYDPGVLCYFALWIFSLVWAILGGIWLGKSTCFGEPIAELAGVIVAIMFIYLVGGPFVVLMSICMDCCRHERGYTKKPPAERGRPSGARATSSASAPLARSEVRSSNSYPGQQRGGGGAAPAEPPPSYAQTVTPTPAPAPAGPSKTEQAKNAVGSAAAAATSALSGLAAKAKATTSSGGSGGASTSGPPSAPPAGPGPKQATYV